MKSSESAAVCFRLIALMVLGLTVLGVLGLPAQAQTRKHVPLLKGPCSGVSCPTSETAGDYDGTGRTDYPIWRPSTGTWWILSSFNPALYFDQAWGIPGDVPVPADYDGDGVTDIAIWRPSTGTWYVIPSSNPTQYIVQQWGIPGDVPMPGDYTGQGPTDFVVWRPSNGTWYVLSSFNLGEFIVQPWGIPGDIPVTGDYDGDGIIDIAVWRPSSGTWFVIPSSAPTTYFTQQFGLPGDIPQPGDYDADGITDFAVWRPAGATWFVNPSSEPTTFSATPWGISTDLPVVNTAPSIQTLEGNRFGARSNGSGAQEVGSNPPAGLGAVRCPAANEAQCATPPAAEAHSLSEAEPVIGPQMDRPFERAVQRFVYWMPPDLRRQSGNISSDVMTRQLSEAPQFMGVPPDMRPEEVGKRSVLPLPPADQKRP